MPTFDVAMSGAGPYFLRLVYEVQPVSGGVQVAATAQWYRNAWGSSSYNSAAAYTIDIGGAGGSSKSGTRNFSAPGGGAIAPQWIESHAVTFVSGTQTYITVTFNTGTTDGGAGSINNLTVPITTATVPSFTPNPATAGAAVTINLPRQNPAYTHDLIYAFGSLASQPITTGAGASHSWTPPLSLLNEIPNATSAQLQIGATTKNGATTIGYQQVNGTLVAGPGVIPTVTGCTYADQNAAVASIVGKPVAGLSRLKLTVSGAGVYSSTITAAEATLQGVTVPSGGEVTVTQSGSLPVTAKVTDSRGRQGTWAGAVDVLPYSPPAASSVAAQRANMSNVADPDGEYIRIDLAASVASLINGTQRNTLTIRVATRPHSGGVWTNRNVISHGSVTYNSAIQVSGGAVFLAGQAWDVRVQVEDKFATYTEIATVATASAAIDVNGTQVGVGKRHEQGALDVGTGGIRDDGHWVINDADFATDTTAGIVQLATQAEVDAGTVTDRAVTPKTLRNAIYSPHADAAGSVNTGATGTTAVSFPAGKFSVPPIVPQPSVTGHPNVCVAFVTGITAAGFSVQVFTLAGAQVAATVNWTAVQMRATSAAG